MSSTHPIRKLDHSSLTDGTFSIVRFSTEVEPSYHDRYALNFYPEHLATEEEMDPVCQIFEYHVCGSTYTIRKLRVMKQATRDEHWWFDGLIRYFGNLKLEILKASEEEMDFLPLRRLVNQLQYLLFALFQSVILLLS